MLDLVIAALVGDVAYVAASEEEGFAIELDCRTLPEGLGVALELLGDTEPILAGDDSEHLEKEIRRLQAARNMSFAIAWLLPDSERPHLRHSPNIDALDAVKLLLSALEEEIALLQETI